MSPWLYGSRSGSDSSSSSTSILTPLPGDDPAVIVGMACRVPGASSPSELWDLIEQQKDVQRKLPENRFNVDSFYHPDGKNKGTTNARYGYFLDQDLGAFDPGFFNLSGNEAEAMDPQQRLLLEVVYEALEDAGIPLEKVAGSQTSVFCGSFTNDYHSTITKDLEYYPKYTITGTGNSILSNRISYFYNLHGASATVDTACSSSLVCFHLGNQTLQAGEASMSIILGSALHFDPTIFITMTDLGMLSTDGRCRAFDADGSGYVRGEGICAILLKRKSQAELDGDLIRAVVRGTGVSHDGTKQGITLPSSESQEALIRQVYRTAGLDPKDTAYFEAHGTGTRVGDPREARAIGAVFAPGTPVSMSTHFILRSPDISPRPMEFWPERWETDPELERYLVPFSKGSQACLGPSMAYCWLNLVLAAVLRRFRLEPFETSENNVATARDCFNGQTAPGQNCIQVKVLGCQAPTSTLAFERVG